MMGDGISFTREKIPSIIKLGKRKYHKKQEKVSAYMHTYIYTHEQTYVQT